MDLGPFLDGTYVTPEPSAGAVREDGVTLLYPGRWHTLIAPTETGKSWWALWHAMHEINAGRYVVYAHFEEASGLGTVGRLLQMGVDKERIREYFVWFSCTTRWQSGEFAAELGALICGPLNVAPALVILDGINAACSMHQWPVDKTEAVGEYRAQFVSPATARDIAVLSLGHPPKQRGREDERHGFGSTAWLDEVDGVGFRLLPTKDKRIAKGATGMSILHTVKDRYGEVSRRGLYRDGDGEGWRYMGAFVVDDSGANTRIRLTQPRDEDAVTDTPADVASRKALEYLRTTVDGSFRSQARLEADAKAAGLGWDKTLTKDALALLRHQGLIEDAPELGTTTAGRLTASGFASDLPAEVKP